MGNGWMYGEHGMREFEIPHHQSPPKQFLLKRNGETCDGLAPCSEFMISHGGMFSDTHADILIHVYLEPPPPPMGAICGNHSSAQNASPEFTPSGQFPWSYSASAVV